MRVAAAVPARVKSGNRVKVAPVRNGSRVRVLVEMIAVPVRNGNLVRALVVMIVARVVNGSRVRVLVEMIVARAKNGSRVKVALVRVAQVVELVVRVVRVVMIVVMTVAKTCRKLRLSVVAPKCLLAKAPVSTAKTSRLATAQIEKSRSLTRVRCVAVSSTPIVARRATRRAVVPASSRALSVAMTARCFPLRQLCKSHWPAKFVVQSETVATTR